MRAIIIAMLMAIGIGLIGISGSTAAPASGAALRRAVSNILPVVPVRDLRGGFRRGQFRHSSPTFHGFRGGTQVRTRQSSPTYNRPGHAHVGGWHHQSWGTVEPIKDQLKQSCLRVCKDDWYVCMLNSGQGPTRTQCDSWYGANCDRACLRY